jgi:hypothetical protein
VTSEKKKPTSGEILRAIARLSSEADWSEAELRESLQEDGIDPDELLQRIMPRVKKLTKQLETLDFEVVKPYLADSQMQSLLDKAERFRSASISRKEAIAEILQLLNQSSDAELESILRELQQRARTRSRT